MPQTVLVPLDGSALAERALPVAANLARAAHGRLLLVRVVRSTSIPPDAASADARTHDQSVRETDYLRGAAATAKQNLGVDAAVAVVDGTASAGIVKAAAAHQATLIVMSTHGRSGLGRWVYGSTTDEVLRAADRPVIVVPSTIQAPKKATTRSPRILVALDGSDRAASLVEPIRRLAIELQAEVVLVRLVPGQPASVFGLSTGVPVLEYAADQLEQAREYLDGLARQLRATVPQVAVRCEPGDPAHRIAEIADEEDADFIALVTRGRRGVQRLFLGSVATATLRRARMPVLLLRSGVTEPVAAEQPASAEPAPEIATVDPNARAMDFSASEVECMLEGLRSLQWGEYTTPADARAIARLRHRLKSDLASSIEASTPV